ncbi:MAG: TVP38/TMEM64 family protein [Deltaproteobacteria bacterium]|nr:MAG: TVP38/TMEM64 family protein [Deltaproteobacteria bacterium]UCH06592.1 MAG: TVP38/TMEM64 family protein [Deltaproteobacteria bacterium]
MWRPIALLVVVIAILVLSYVFGIGEKLAALRGWIEALGALGPAVFILIYAGAVVAAIPGSAITIIAGAIFGSVLGVIVVSIASTVGAALAFLVGRHFARDATAKWLSKSEKFKELDDLTEKHGAIIVALVRIVPIFPFNIVNYGFGLTRVRFRTYVFWSWLCMLPGTVLYVVGTDAISQAIIQKRIPWPLTGVLIGVGILLVVLVKLARKRLHEEDQEMAEPQETGNDTA